MALALTDRQGFFFISARVFDDTDAGGGTGKRFSIRRSLYYSCLNGQSFSALANGLDKSPLLKYMWDIVPHNGKRRVAKWFACFHRILFEDILYLPVLFPYL